jgi:hypothetical protein
MPFSTFSWYTGNVFTFCSGTGNDALQLLIWMLLFGFYNFGHSSKTVVSNGRIFSISKVSCSDKDLFKQFLIPVCHISLYLLKII